MSLFFRWIVASLCLASAVPLVAVPSAAYSQGRFRDRRSSPNQLQSGMRKAFQEATGTAQRATVLIECDRTPKGFGLIVRPEGWILTKGSELYGEIKVRLADGRTLPAKNVGYFPGHDLGLIKVDAGTLPVAVWGEKDPEPGSLLASVGIEDEPISVGVVSVARRSIPRIRGVLGIRLKRAPGPAEIAEVYENGAAESAGIMTGDVVEQINDVQIKDQEGLVREIGRHQPGDVLSLALRRRGEAMAIKAQLTHPFGEFMSRVAEQNLMGGDLSDRRADFPAVIQHDSVLRPNQCGGPAVGLDGKVVGLNIARAGRTETFLVPAAVITPLIDDLIAGKYPPPPPIDLQPLIPPPPSLPVLIGS